MKTIQPFAKTRSFKEENGVRMETSLFSKDIHLSNSKVIEESLSFAIGKKLGVKTNWILEFTVDWLIEDSNNCQRCNYCGNGKNPNHKLHAKIISLKIHPDENYSRHRNEVSYDVFDLVKYSMKLLISIRAEKLGNLLSFSSQQESLELDVKDPNALSSFVWEEVKLPNPNLNPVLTIKLEVVSSLQVDIAKHRHSLCQPNFHDLAKAIETGEHYDVVLKVSGPKEQRGKKGLPSLLSLSLLSDSDSSAADISTRTDFKAHKVILAAKCLQLKKIFAAGNKTEVFIRGVSPEAMQIFLHFVYTGKLAEGWGDVVEELIDTGKKLDVPSIFPILDKRLIEASNEDNVGKLLYLAQTHNLATAKQDLYRLIKNSTTA